MLIHHSGGTLIADFLARTSGPVNAANISTAVRTEEQARVLSSLGINVIKVDLDEETAVIEAVLRNNSTHIKSIKLD